MMSGQTELKYKKTQGGFAAGTSEQLSAWGSTGGRPREWTEDKLIELGYGLLQWFDESDDNIFFEKYLLDRGLYREIISQQSEQSEGFAQIIKQAKEKQELKIAQGAMQGKYRDAMSIFTLKNKHGWADKVEHQHTGEQMPFVLNFALLPPGKTPIQIEGVEIPIQLDKPPERLNDTNETKETPE